MNNHGSRKVLQWTLDIQHYDATIEHVPGKANIPADVFSRLVPHYVTPLIVAVKDTDETVVESILQHDFSDPNDKKWLVRWLRDLPSESWERYDNLKNVEAFHQYCATNRLDPFLPKADPAFSASVPNMYRRSVCSTCCTISAYKR